MIQDMYYAEVKRIEQIEQARRLQAKELSQQQVFEASWCAVIILFLTLVVGWFS